MFHLCQSSMSALAIALVLGSGSAAAAQTVASTATAAPAQETLAAAQVTAGPELPQVGDEVIVTGTRATGVTAVESATPIKVLGEETLSHVGQPNLNQVLTQLVPSFTAQAFGGDTANLTLSARLRGLSPNHTLVLVNGKRRHGTSNLAVLGGPFQGAATADLDLISPSSIKRIEVLEDGAAAQYGSDAIAGVINVILKDDAEGGDGNLTAGEYYKTGGETLAGTLHLATRVGDGGFINVTAFHRYVDFTQSGGLDRRVTDINGNLLPVTGTPGATLTLTPLQRQLFPLMDGFPFVNKINGNARSQLTNLQYNSSYDFGGVTAYSFGTFSRRIASGRQNVRVPTRVARTVNGVTTYFDPDGDTPPNGFTPREKTREEDFAFTGGVKGAVSTFRWDLSATYGRDKNQIYTVDSANASLYADTGFTPTSFYNGFFKAAEFTLNADVSTQYDIGLSEPVNIAFGGEYRRNVYQIGSGDPASIYKEGGQAYPGFRPSDAAVNKRNNKSVYLDVAAMATEDWKIDGAVRYEHYSDFGSKVIFKATTRYDFSPAFALRGTAATGFRAPTLAESFYSATNVSPTAAFVQLPANSAAAQLLGFRNLDAEKSTNFSLGTVIRPADRLTITLDAYQIKIRDRILGTGSLFSSGGGTNAAGQSLNFPLVRSAIIANGNVLDPTVVQTGVNIFTNGADTRTRGVDLVVSYLTDFNDYGTVNWTVSGNYNKTRIIDLDTAPPLVNVNGQTVTQAVFDLGARSNLETASPRVKVVTSAFWTIERFSATLRGTVYGKSSVQSTPNGADFYKQRIGTAFIGDIELNYRLTDDLELSGGANNVFNKRPPIVALVPGTTNQTLVNGGNVLDAPLTFSPYGINGGYYYARLNFNF